MTKQMLRCSECGFVAFLEPIVQPYVGGWVTTTHPDGTLKRCCPACLGEKRVEHDPPKVRAVAR